MQIKQLAVVSDISDSKWTQFMRELNELARRAGLLEYNTYSRIWEYPWLWFQLESLKKRNLRILDIGSERSPFPWYLATQGFDVIVSDTTLNYRRLWKNARRSLGVSVTSCTLDAQQLALPTASVDVYLSVSVLEHVPEKLKAITEAARVLRPGGLLVMTFDLCEPETGMSFPEWNGRAVSMHEFDKLIGSSPWLDQAVMGLEWNTETIPDYLAWHRSTAPHHNYVTGAAVIRRNDNAWKETAWSRFLRMIRTSTVLGLKYMASFALQSASLVKKVFRKLLAGIAFMGNRMIGSPLTVRKIGGPILKLLRPKPTSRFRTLSDVKHALIVRLDGIGDMVLMTPFLRELRRNIPNARLSLVVKPAVFNLVERCPYVDHVLSYDCDTSGGLRVWRRHWRALRLAREFWRQHPVDLVLLPRWDSDTYHGAFVAYFSGAPVRVAYAERVNKIKQQLNAGYDALFTHIVSNGSGIHEVQRDLNVLEYLGGAVKDKQLELWLDRADELFASHEIGTFESNVIAFGVGKRNHKRMWPLWNFLQLGGWLRDARRARILVLGGSDEQPIGEELRKQLGEAVINLAGHTTLRQAGALLKHCQLYVGVDSGPMHLAAAMGVPVIEISCHPKSGSPTHENAPQRFRPWGVPSIIVQPETPRPPCRDACVATEAHCILDVSIERVREAVMTQLAAASNEKQGARRRVQ
jgi:ADP-heptose:LPS heptosyltransferase/SAM-dependent methyltransferase